MSVKKIIIIGGGGHGKVVADILQVDTNYEVVGFIDDNIQAGTEVFNGLKCLGVFSDYVRGKFIADCAVIAIGNNEVRRDLYDRLVDHQLVVERVIHPNAIVAPSAIIGQGAVVLQGAILSSLTVVGNGAIIDAGAIVNHEAHIGNFAHVTIGSVVGNNVFVSDFFKTTLGGLIQPFSRV